MHYLQGPLEPGDMMIFGGLVFTMPATTEAQIELVKKKYDDLTSEMNALYQMLADSTDPVDIDRLIPDLSAVCERRMIMAKIYHRSLLLHNPTASER